MLFEDQSYLDSLYFFLVILEEVDQMESDQWWEVLVIVQE